MDIIKEVKKFGYKVDLGLYQLQNYRSYKDIVDILIKYLTYIDDEVEKEEIVRILSKKFAKSEYFNTILFKEFFKSDSLNYKWAIGNAFCYVLIKKNIDEVIKIILNKDNSKSREMFVIALSKFKTREIECLFIKLLKDDDLTSHTLEAVRKMKFKGALPYVKRYAEDKRKLIRREALKTLKVLTELV